MSKKELEEYINSQGGYSKMDGDRLKYLRKFYEEKETEKIQEKNEKFENLERDLKVAITNVMMQYGYGVGSSEFCSVARKVIDSLDD